MFADQKICKECNHRWAVIMTPLHVGVCKCGKPRSFMLVISTERSVWSITLQGRSINLNRYLHSLTQNNKYSVVPCTQNPWFQIFRCIFTQFGRTKHRSWLCSRNIHCLRSLPFGEEALYSANSLYNRIHRMQSRFWLEPVNVLKGLVQLSHVVPSLTTKLVQSSIFF